jgi:hypothetical protein
LCYDCDIGVTTRVASSLRRSVGVKKLFGSFVVVSALLVPSVTSADVISMDFTGTGKGAGVNIQGIGTVFAGELTWTLDGATDIMSFCVDLHNWLGDPQQADAKAITDLTGATADAGLKVAYLYNSYVATAVKTDFLAAATQIAIWRIIEGSAFQFGSSSSYDAFNNATNDLVALATSNYLMGNTNALFLDVLTGPRGQDQVTRSVPEPGTLLLLGAGALALAARRRMARNAN